MSHDGCTAEEQLGDVPAELLVQLAKLRTDFCCAGGSLALLAGHSGNADLHAAAEAARILASRYVSEQVRDVAATLPLRGLEFGLEPHT